MRASTTSGSPLPHRQTKASIATLVAFCALAAGAQALAPASAGAMVDQKAGGCFAIPLGEGVIAWRTVHGEACYPADGDHLRLADNAIGDFYDVANLPARYPGLNLPGRRDAGGIPGQRQHLGPLGRFRWPKPKGGGGRKSGAPVSEVKRWPTKPKKEPQKPQTPAKPRKPLSPECKKLLANLNEQRIGYVQTSFQAFKTAKKATAHQTGLLIVQFQSFYEKKLAAEAEYKRKCADLLEWLD